MARKPLAHVATQLPEVNDEALAADLLAADQVSVGQRMVMDAAGILKQVGRIEAMQFSATVAERVIAETYAKIKESKAYNGLPYRDADGNTRQVASLEEFCEAYMPRSHRRCQELAANLHLLGAELYEQAEALGFRQRDYNALKALPADDQAIVRQAIEAGKLDSAIELMQDMAVKHAAEKADLHKEVEEAQANYEGLVKVSETKEKLINDQQREMAKLRRRLESMTPDEVGADLRREVAGVGFQIEGLINTDLMTAFDALAEHAETHDCTHEEFMSGLLFGIERALLAVRNKHNVKAAPDGDERPDWTRDDFDADAVVAAALAKETGHA